MFLKGYMWAEYVLHALGLLCAKKVELNGALEESYSLQGAK